MTAGGVWSGLRANRNIPSGKERLIGNLHYPVDMWVVFLYVFLCSVSNLEPFHASFETLTEPNLTGRNPRGKTRAMV